MPDSSPEDSVEEGHDPGSDSVGVPVVQFTVVTGAPLGLQVDHGMDVETGLHVAVVRGALEAAVATSSLQPAVDDLGGCVEDLLWNAFAEATATRSVPAVLLCWPSEHADVCHYPTGPIFTSSRNR